MSNITLKYALNRDIEFVRIINFLVSYRIMTLEDSSKLQRQYRQGRDVTFIVDDEKAPMFIKELVHLGCKL